jgi:vancomycin permeability regulator SanA
MQKSKQFLTKFVKAVQNHQLALLAVMFLALVMIFAPISYTFLVTRGDRYDLSRTTIDRIPYRKVAIVFGAGIQKNGTPTPYLQYRVETAVKLYKAHRISELLMSGDNSTTAHNEPVVMKNYAVKLGIPTKDIILDYAGFNTYDSCYREHAIFGLTSATLISQGYHLPRAMVTCRGLGVQNIGVIAEHPARDYTINYQEQQR